MIIDFDGLTIILGIVIYIFICIIIYKKKTDKIFFVFSTIMFIYFMCVIKIALFPVIMIKGLPSNIYKSFNFIPFRGGVNVTDVQNLIMTVPLGIGMPFISGLKNLKRILAGGVVTGITIETIQDLESLLCGGFTNRIIDINDIIFNTLGMLVGFLLLYWSSKIFLKLTHSKKLNDFWKYVYGVCDRIQL